MSFTSWFRYCFYVVVLLAVAGVGSSVAGWKKVGQFSGTRANCGFFWDENNGLVGFGMQGNGLNIKAVILRTVDGGITWTTCASPVVNGQITSIFMKDKLVGYASLFETIAGVPKYSLWKTNDGGVTWFDHTQNNPATTLCVYATSRALIRTTWSNGNVGGFSVDDGRTYNKVFTNGSTNRSNGIDFVDDRTGIVTFGPPNQYFSVKRTQDGGLSWQSGDALPESWSVYGVKNTNIFLAMPEGNSNRTNSSFYRTNDAGFSWKVEHDFGFDFFTGHTGGVGATVYVQTSDASQRGIYRSDDLGVNWKSVGGPSNNRDTRFVVLGCKGEIVYAFDNSGGVWKTIDGGDGTLKPPLTSVSLDQGLLNLSSVCTDARAYVRLDNSTCSTYIIDSLSFNPDPAHEFSIDSSKQNFSVGQNDGVGLPILFKSDSNVTRDTKLVIHGHMGSTKYDTTIIIHATHSWIPGPIASLSSDALTLRGKCVPARDYFTIINKDCNPLVIDSVKFTTNPDNEFSIDTSLTNLRVGVNSSTLLPVLFKTDSIVTRHVSIHIHAHSGIRVLDTFISVVATHETIDGPLLGLPEDSLSFSSTCQVAGARVTLLNNNCDSLIIDAISFVDNQYGEFSIDTNLSGLNILANDTIGIPISFQTDSDITRLTSIHVRGHSSNRTIDTIITVRAQHFTTPGPLLSIRYDSVYFETRYCQPLHGVIPIANTNCNPMVIDTVMMDPQYPELIVDTTQFPKLFLPRFGSGGVPIFFQTDSNITRHTRVRIIAHSFLRTIDTTIILVAKHSTAPEPIIATPSMAKVGETVLIPIYLRPTTDSFSISHLSLHLSYDGDVLSLAEEPYNVLGTLCAAQQVRVTSSEPNGLRCDLDFNSPITQSSNLSLPLIYVKMQVFLARNLFSNIQLDTFSITHTSPLPLCTIPNVMFVVDPTCGDQIISHYMFDSTMPSFLSTHPNPTSGKSLDVAFYLPRQDQVWFEAFDEQGIMRKEWNSAVDLAAGIHHELLDIDKLQSGHFTLHMNTRSGANSRRTIIIIR
ncbi:MAG: hypothetical protein WCH46_01470 [bacterium]